MKSGTQRITLLDGDDSVLCGTYKPPGHSRWRLYMSATLARVGSPAALMLAQHLRTLRRDAFRGVTPALTGEYACHASGVVFTAGVGAARGPSGPCPQ